MRNCDSSHASFFDIKVSRLKYSLTKRSLMFEKLKLNLERFNLFEQGCANLCDTVHHGVSKNLKNKFVHQVTF